MGHNLTTEKEKKLENKTNDYSKTQSMNEEFQTDGHWTKETKAMEAVS